MIELLDEPVTAITVQDRAAVALGSGKARTELAALVLRSANVKEIKNAAGRDEAHSFAMALVKARTSMAKIGKAARDDATMFSKAVIAEEKALLEITTPEEMRLLALRDAWDAARAFEKAEAERIEVARIVVIQLRIADIRDCAGLATQCKTSAAVEVLIQSLTDISMGGFAEFADDAHAAREASLARMKEISDAKHAEESERARIKAELVAEADRLSAERAQIAKERAEAVERERFAAKERAELERIQTLARAAEHAAQQAALDAQRAEQAKADNIAADARKAQDAADKAVRDAEAKKLADERAAFAAEQADARAVQEAENIRLADVAAELERQRIAALPKAEPVAAIPDAPILLAEPLTSQPSDAEIFTALAEYFDEEIEIVRGWVANMEFMKETS